MAKKKEADTAAEETTAQATEATTEQAAEEQRSQDENTPETTPAQPQTAEEETATPATPVAEEEEKLFSLDELEQRHRVPGWQQAALMRLMGWQRGKMLTEAEYEAGLDQLNNRRVGGGRR